MFTNTNIKLSMPNKKKITKNFKSQEKKKINFFKNPLALSSNICYTIVILNGVIGLWCGAITGIMRQVNRKEKKMSLKRLKKLAIHAYMLLSLPREFAGFAGACHIMGIEVYPRVGGAGVIVRSSKFWVERFLNGDGLILWNIFNR